MKESLHDRRFDDEGYEPPVLSHPEATSFFRISRINEVTHLIAKTYEEWRKETGIGNLSCYEGMTDAQRPLRCFEGEDWAKLTEQGVRETDVPQFQRYAKRMSVQDPYGPHGEFVCGVIDRLTRIVKGEMTSADCLHVVDILRDEGGKTLETLKRRPGSEDERKS